MNFTELKYTIGQTKLGIYRQISHCCCVTVFKQADAQIQSQAGGQCFWQIDRTTRWYTLRGVRKRMMII